MIKNIKKIRVYNGFFKMDKITFDQTKFNGKDVMKDVVREVFVRDPVVILSLYDPIAKLHLLTEQVRVGAIASDLGQICVLEPIAGIIDDGEQPLEAAAREAKEETGVDVDIDSIKVIQKGFTSPGGSSEFAYFATGLFDSTTYVEQEGGVDGEQEDIRTHLVEDKYVLEMIESGKINSLSAAFGIYWHKVHSNK